MTFSPPRAALFIGLLSAAFSLCLAGGSQLFAQESEIHIENSGAYRHKSRPAVYFPHEAHMEIYECLDCHHDYKDGKNILEEDNLDEDGSARCARCHSKNASVVLKTAYHRQCMGCHRLINKQENAFLPITCQDCHNRKALGRDSASPTP